MEALKLEICVSKLEAFPGWKVLDGKLHREFCFENFVSAFGFMTQVALCAEAMNHHPEWSNIYNRVNIQLITHDAGPGVSVKDFELLKKIEQIYSS